MVEWMDMRFWAIENLWLRAKYTVSSGSGIMTQIHSSIILSSTLADIKISIDKLF